MIPLAFDDAVVGWPDIVFSAVMLAFVAVILTITAEQRAVDLAARSWVRGAWLAPVLASMPWRIRARAIVWAATVQVCRCIGRKVEDFVAGTGAKPRTVFVLGGMAYAPYRTAWSRWAAIRAEVEREENRREAAAYARRERK